jgi:hypothetical protein
VRNLRAKGNDGTLWRGRRVAFDAAEVTTEESVPVIRRSVRDVPVTHAYWDIDQVATDEAVRHEAANHPVFRLRQSQDE